MGEDLSMSPIGEVHLPTSYKGPVEDQVILPQ